jgi:orotate phosphoribosyltransferase
MNESAWEAARQQLIRLLREHAVHYGPTTIEPEVVTDVLIDPSRVTLRGDGLALIEALLVPLLRQDRVEAVGGPAMGAIPLVTLLARQQWPAFYLRLGAQVHGRRSPISGTPPQPGMAVALLEDLAATGTSLLRCCEVVQGLGARVVSLYALVDREQGTRERFAAHGLRYRPLITFSELIQPAPETGDAS